MGQAMILARRRVLKLAAAAAAIPAASRLARADAFPSRPVTIVVPFPAGGPTDTLARILGEYMRKSLGQSVIVENLSGAAGSVGMARVARPDGAVVGLTLFASTWIFFTLLMIAMLALFGPRHPTVWDEHVPLDRGRIVLALCAVLIFALCFTPAPITIADLTGH